MHRKLIIALAVVISFTLNTQICHAVPNAALSAFNSLSLDADPHTGSANLSIPISAVPGRGGIEPNITLAYNSSLPNGILGVGWMMELGSIKRSTKRGLPQFNGSDSFVMEQSGGAQELEYDSAAGFYRSKIEGGFSKIVYDSVNMRWIMTDKNGVKYYFGQTTASREDESSNSSRIYRWGLDRVEDVKGNYMTISYFKDSRQIYPQYIDYTGNSLTNDAPYARVEFQYDGRIDWIRQASFGFEKEIQYKLKRIYIYANGIQQRSYDFDYLISTPTGRSMLSMVHSKNNDGSQELPQTIFDYTDYSSHVHTVSPAPQSPSGTGNNQWKYQYAGGYDRGGSNYGPIPPYSGGSNGFGSLPFTSAVNQGSSNGSISFSGAKDTAYWLYTFVYAAQNTALTVPWTAGAAVGVYINGNYGTSVGTTWNLVAGWNRIDITAYDQSSNFNFNLNYSLAGNVSVMNTDAYSRQAFAADFNGDAFSDMGWYDSVSGNFSVSLNNGQGSFGTAANWGSYASSMPLVLGNFNSDGRVDIATFNKSNGQWNVYTSTGTGFTSAGTWISNFGTNQDKITTGDFNGDGLTDIAYYMLNPDYYAKFAINQGTNSFVEVAGPGKFVGGNNDEIYTGDFNGDGLTDFANGQKSTGTYSFRISRGDYYGSYLGVTSLYSFGVGRNPIFADFTGDGMTDIGYVDASTGKVNYKISDIYGFYNSISTTFSFSGNSLNSDIFVQSADFDGDGLTDFLAANSMGATQMAKSGNGNMSDLINDINNSVGGITTLSYKSSTSYPNSLLPFAVQTVNTVTKSNSLGSSYMSRYDYSGGYWDGSDRDFRGFGMVKITDPDGNYAQIDYAQGAYTKGRVLESRSYDVNGNLFAKTTNTWQEDVVAGTIKFVYLKEKNDYIYDGNSTGRRTKEKYFFTELPQYGNLTQKISYGEVDLSTGNDIGTDSTTVDSQYVYNTSKWILGLPYHLQAKDYYGTIISHSWMNYDNQANGTNPVLGRLTQKEDWNGSAQGSASNPKTQYQYDTFGNLIKTIDSLGNNSTITYDPNLHVFPLQATNALGHTVENEYYGINGIPQDDGAGLTGLWGQLRNTTDPNNQVGTAVYDSFGRQIYAISPLDSVSFPTTETGSDYYSTFVMVSKESRIDSGASDTLARYQFIDGLGRVIQIKTPSDWSTGQYIVSGQTEYNSRGLPSRKYVPFYSTNPLVAIEPIDPTRTHTDILYDAMGRVVKTINPDGTYSTIVYDDWHNVITNENGFKQESFYDAYGRLIEKDEFTGADGRSPNYPSSAYTLYSRTRYNYDSKGDLVSTVDNLGNTTTIAYDILGRKISMRDPDMGTWSYVYDLNGNLKQQTDALGKKIYFTYDALNRLTNKTDTVNLNVNYTYDNAGVANSKGRLTKASYAVDNDTQFDYDVLGREIHSIKKINNVDYEVYRDYNALNNLVDVVYPDTKKAFYQYNTVGQVEGVMDADPWAGPVNYYAQNIRYNEFGQMTYIHYGNGTKTNYTYSSLTQRLTNIQTLGPSNNVIQNLSYQYDSVGNVMKITDGVNTATQTFAYDALNRLTTAVGSYGTKTYSYDTIGNIKQKDGLTYAYSGVGAGPHAVTSLSDGTVFTYDLDGNMKTKKKGSDTWTYYYDAENHLNKICKNNVMQVRYFYDGDGGRIRKSVSLPSVNEVRYVGQLYEKTNGTPADSIFLGSQRIATVSNGKVLYTHADHLGSLNITTDASGAVVELAQYEPFGKFSRHDFFGNAQAVAHNYFTSQYNDDESGLYYYGARYYDPQLGKFITADTIVQAPNNPQTLNRYTYCNNNPVNLVDPSGHGWLQNIFKSLNKIFDKAVNWLEKVTNSEWNVNVEFGQSYQFQDANTLTQSTARVGVTLVTQPWQIGLGVKSWIYEPRFEILEKIQEGEFSHIRGSAIEDGNSVFVNGILNNKFEATRNARKAYATKVAFNPSDGVVADLTESFLQKLFFTSSLDRQLANSLVGHKGISLSGHSQGAIIAANALLNLGLRNQRDVVSSVQYINTQISQPRAYLSAGLAGIEGNRVIYGSRYFDFSNALGPNLQPAKFISGVIGLTYLPLGMDHHGIE